MHRDPLSETIRLSLAAVCFDNELWNLTEIIQISYSSADGQLAFLQLAF